MLKHLLKRGALLAAANWQAVALQFAAQVTFQALLAVPTVGTVVLVAVFLGADAAHLTEGGIRDMVANIANALMSEPVAFGAFLTAFGLVYLGGSVFLFLVKGGIVSVLSEASLTAEPIEREPLGLDVLARASRFTLDRFTHGCGHLFRRYLGLGLLRILVLGISAALYLAFLVFGYQAAGDRLLLVGWGVMAAFAGFVLIVWITVVNLLYLLTQMVIAVDDVPLGSALGGVTRFIRTEPRELWGVFLIVLAMVVGATLASTLAWSGVGLIAFVPLVGLAVFPLQIAALLVRGLVFEYIGLTALGAYLALYRRHAAVTGQPVGLRTIREQARAQG